MAEEAARLQYRLEASTARFESQIKRAERTMMRSAKRMDREAGRVDSRLSRFGVGFAGQMRTLLPALGFAALARGADRAITSLDNIGKTASKIGLTTDALQELRSAGEQSGVATRTTDMALQRFVRRLAEARNGTGEAKAALAEMNIELTDATGAARPTEAVLNDVADAMAGMDSQSDRLRVAFKLFDSEGAALVNTLGKGSAALDEMRQRARDLGSVIDSKTIKSAEDLRTEIDLLATALGDTFVKGVGIAALALNRLFNIDGKGAVRAMRGEIEDLSKDFNYVNKQLRALDTAPSTGADSSAADEEMRRVLIKRRDEIAGRLKSTIDAVNAATPDAIEPSGPLKTGGGGSGGGKGKTPKEQESEYDKLTLAIHEKNLATREELELVGLSGAAHERRALSLEEERLYLDLVAAAHKDGLPMDRERTAAINEMVDAYAALREKLIAANEEQERHEETLQESARAAEEARRGIEQIGNALTGAIQNATSFSDALRSVGLQLANIGIQGLAGAGPLGSALGDIIPGLFRPPAAPSTSPSPMARPKAIGGPVNAGSPYLVGERGPEIVVPRAAGNVIPNNRIGGAVNVSLNVDARGAGDPGAIEAAVSRSSAAILSAVPEVVRQAVRKGAL